MLHDLPSGALVPLTFSQRPDESLGPPLTAVPDTLIVSIIGNDGTYR